MEEFYQSIDMDDILTKKIAKNDEGFKEWKTIAERVRDGIGPTDAAINPILLFRVLKQAREMLPLSNIEFTLAGVLDPFSEKDYENQTLAPHPTVGGAFYVDTRSTGACIRPDNEHFDALQRAYNQLLLTRYYLGNPCVFYGRLAFLGLYPFPNIGNMIRVIGSDIDKYIGVMKHQQFKTKDSYDELLPKIKLLRAVPHKLDSLRDNPVNLGFLRNYNNISINPYIVWPQIKDDVTDEEIFNFLTDEQTFNIVFSLFECDSEYHFAENTRVYVELHVQNEFSSEDVQNFLQTFFPDGRPYDVDTLEKKKKAFDQLGIAYSFAEDGNSVQLNVMITVTDVPRLTGILSTIPKNENPIFPPSNDTFLKSMDSQLRNILPQKTLDQFYDLTGLQPIWLIDNEPVYVAYATDSDAPFPISNPFYRFMLARFFRIQVDDLEQYGI